VLLSRVCICTVDPANAEPLAPSLYAHQSLSKDVCTGCPWLLEGSPTPLSWIAQIWKEKMCFTTALASYFPSSRDSELSFQFTSPALAMLGSLTRGTALLPLWYLALPRVVTRSSERIYLLLPAIRLPCRRDISFAPSRSRKCTALGRFSGPRTSRHIVQGDLYPPPFTHAGKRLPSPYLISPRPTNRLY
jgi:hypothetical protein